jgi:chromosome segregation and condensation protein ScpB
LYATTKTFLRAFGLNSLADLPEVDALRRPVS